MYVIFAHFNKLLAYLITFGISGCILKNTEYCFVSMLCWPKFNSRPPSYLRNPITKVVLKEHQRDLVIHIGYQFDSYIKAVQNC